MSLTECLYVLQGFSSKLVLDPGTGATYVLFVRVSMSWVYPTYAHPARAYWACVPLLPDAGG